MFILRSAYVRSSSAAAAAPGGGDYSLRDNRNIRQKTPAECGMWAPLQTELTRSKYPIYR